MGLVAKQFQTVPMIRPKGCSSCYDNVIFNFYSFILGNLLKVINKIY